MSEKEKVKKKRLPFARRLKMLMDEKSMSLYQMGEVCGLEYKTIWRYTHGESSPNIERLIDIATSLEVSTDYLLGLTEERELVKNGR